MWCSLTGYQVKLSQQLEAAQPAGECHWLKSFNGQRVCFNVQLLLFLKNNCIITITTLKMFYWMLFSLSANFFCVRKHPGDQVVVIYVSVLFDLTWWSRSNQVNTNRAANSLWGCGRDACLKEKTTNINLWSASCKLWFQFNFILCRCLQTTITVAEQHFVLYSKVIGPGCTLPLDPCKLR